MKDTFKLGAIVERETTATRAFDGDGELIKDAINYYCRECLANPNTLNYYVRSSVLGEVVLTVGATGEKRFSYVYGDGELVATQSISYSNFTPTTIWQWRQEDPSGTTEYNTEQNYSAAPAVLKTEMDAVGADVGLADPYPAGGEAPNTASVGEDLLARHSDVTDLKGGCYWVGIPAPCAIVLKASEDAVEFSIEKIAADSAPEPRRRPRLKDVSEAEFQKRKKERKKNRARGNRVSPRTETTTRPSNYKPLVRQDFNRGKFANFTSTENYLLKRAFEKITHPDCISFFNQTLAEMRANGSLPAFPDTNPWFGNLESILAAVPINKYASSLTAEQVGVSEASWSNVQSKFDQADDQGKIGWGVTVYPGGLPNVFLPDRAFNRPGVAAAFFGQLDGDTAGIIIHEFFHAAGLNEDQVRALRSGIQINCGTPGAGGV